MLTQGLAPNPKGKLNISSVITPPHLLDCLISTNHFLCPFYCYYEWWGNGIGGRWLIRSKVCIGGQRVGIIS